MLCVCIVVTAFVVEWARCDITLSVSDDIPPPPIGESEMYDSEGPVALFFGQVLASQFNE